MAKYQIGDKVWAARCGHRDVQEICPVCFGKLQVVLILGNDDTVTLPCDYCGKGYNAPTGTVTEHVFFSGAELCTIDAVNIERTASGDEANYRSQHYVLYPPDIFDTEAEALARCEEKAAQLNKEQRERAECIKANVNKTFSWNAGYHLREAKRKESEAARHRENAKLCKGREDKKISI